MTQPSSTVNQQSSPAGHPCHPNEAITLRNQKESRLLSLPAEIRNQIFTYVYGGLNFYVLNNHSIFPTESYRIATLPADLAAPSPFAPSSLVGPRPPSMLLCRQIHAETAMLPFTSNHFTICDLAAFQWLVEDLTPKQANAITTLRIKLDSAFVGLVAFPLINMLDSVVGNVNTKFTKHFRGLEKLGGLQRMIVEIKVVRRNEAFTEHRRHVVQGLVKQWGGDEGLELVFKKF